MSVLEELGTVLKTTGDIVASSVVGIGNRWSAGSGVVIAPGQVLTNAHHLSDQEITVTFADDRTATASVLGVDVDGDLAVLAADTADATPVNWSDRTLEVGTPVIGAARPGGRALRVTFGFVSAIERRFRGPRGRRISGGFEHTAPLLRGSSGGPVVDTEGALLGINTHRLGGGFYIAQPATPELRAKVEALAEGKAPAARRIGVALAPGRVAARLRKAVGLPERDGLLVRGVEEDGPAARAGVKEGDLIVSAGGQPTVRMDDLFQALNQEGETIELGLVRGSEELTVTVTF